MLKNWWGAKSYWLKGGFIGSLLGFIIGFTYFFFYATPRTQGSLFEITIGIPIAIAFSIPVIIISMIIGILMSWIIEKIKQIPFYLRISGFIGALLGLIIGYVISSRMILGTPAFINLLSSIPEALSFMLIAMLTTWIIRKIKQFMMNNHRQKNLIKGGLIGGLVGFLVILPFIIFQTYLHSGFVEHLEPTLIPLENIFQAFMGILTNIPIILLFSLIGILISWIIDKVKSK